MSVCVFLYAHNTALPGLIAVKNSGSSGSSDLLYFYARDAASNMSTLCVDVDTARAFLHHMDTAVSGPIIMYDGMAALQKLGELSDLAAAQRVGARSIDILHNFQLRAGFSKRLTDLVSANIDDTTLPPPLTWSYGSVEEGKKYAAAVVDSLEKLTLAVNGRGMFNFKTQRGVSRSVMLKCADERMGESTARLLTVDEMRCRQAPDTSWMDKPMDFWKFTRWLGWSGTPVCEPCVYTIPLPADAVQQLGSDADVRAALSADSFIPVRVPAEMPERMSEHVITRDMCVKAQSCAAAVRRALPHTYEEMHAFKCVRRLSGTEEVAVASTRAPEPMLLIPHNVCEQLPQPFINSAAHNFDALVDSALSCMVHRVCTHPHRSESPSKRPRVE